MDIKIQGITEQILTEALEQAKKARMEILAELTSTISEPRKELSPYAPKIEMIQIDQLKLKMSSVKVAKQSIISSNKQA